MRIRGLIERQAAGSFTLTAEGRAVLEALMMRAATRG
jgi:Mn-dependent DtxR family transcriptional regulator